MKHTLVANIETYIERFFGKGHERTIKAKKNIVALFILRGVIAGTNFLIVPLTLHYLNPTRYGIWLTLTSLIGLAGLLDLGLGHGLRNKLAEAIARSNEALAHSYVSTAYAVIAGFVIVISVLFLSINPFLHWSSILNTGPEMSAELSLLAAIVFLFFLLRLVFGLIGTVLLAMQRPAMSTLLEAIINMLTLILVYILTKVSFGSLLFLGFAVSATGALVPLGANFWFFKNTYPQLAPSFHSIDLVYSRDLLGLGVQFFILQITGLIVFSTANIIIAQLFGPLEVTTYNIAFKYYGIALTGFMILLTPFWTAFTDAFVRTDYAWIRRAIRSLVKYWLLLCVGVVVMTIVADRFYLLWVGTSVHVPFELSLLMGIYVIIFTWSYIFAVFVNGTGKIRLMIWSSVIVALINIPLSIFLAKNLGLKNAGVVLGSCISLLPGCVMWPVQMMKLLRGRAKGIWAR